MGSYLKTGPVVIKTHQIDSKCLHFITTVQSDSLLLLRSTPVNFFLVHRIWGHSPEVLKEGCGPCSWVVSRGGVWGTLEGYTRVPSSVASGACWCCVGSGTVYWMVSAELTKASREGSGTLWHSVVECLTQFPAASALR